MGYSFIKNSFCGALYCFFCFQPSDMAADDEFLDDARKTADEKVERDRRRKPIRDKKNQRGHDIAHLHLHTARKIIFETCLLV